MADRAQQIIRFAGYSAAGFLAALSLGTLLVVALRAGLFSGDLSGISASDWAALQFTLLQAILSTGVSVLLAIPVARALARRQFWGRGFLITLLGAPFILPVIVAVLGILAIYGRGGLLSNGLDWLGYGRLDIYGLTGVVLAHVFFNLPLATRFILQGWQTIPSEHFRLAAQLGMNARDVAKRLEWPMLRSVLPGVMVTIFLLCLTSFAVALTLGGGPKATTIELAIYQAFRFDFDLGKAAILACMQFSICLIAALMAWQFAGTAQFGGGLDKPLRRWDGQNPIAIGLDVLALTLATLFLLAPLAMIVWNGVSGLAEIPASILPASLRSVVVSLAAAMITLGLALVLSGVIVQLEISRTKSAGLIEATGYLSIAASPMVIGTGIFILVFPYLNPASLALPLTALVNAAMALPFALRAILPAMRKAEADFGPLADSLDMRGWPRFRLMIWPRIRPAAGFATGLAAALSMGDLGVVALFADPEAATLPLVMYRLMGSYQMEAAQGAALLLVALSLALFWVFDRGGRYHVAD